MVSERGQGEVGESGPLPQLSARPFGFFTPKPAPLSPKETHTPRRCGANTVSDHTPSIHFLGKRWICCLLVGCRRGLSQDLGKAVLRSGCSGHT